MLASAALGPGFGNDGRLCSPSGVLEAKPKRARGPGPNISLMTQFSP